MPFPIQDFYLKGLKLFFQLWFLWLPVFLGYLAWYLWNYHKKARFLSSLEWTILEVKLPREIHKSPRAMEVFLNSLHITKDGNAWERYIQGFLRPFFSLEIAGINSEIHFFIYTQKFYRNLVEAQLYAQYPDVEITEVEDYSKEFFTEGFLEKWNCFGTEFVLTDDDAYPIKTYVDYGLHEILTKEEQKVDPMTAFIELLGSLKPGEQIWLQILVRATKKDWKAEGKKLVEKILKEKSTPEQPISATGLTPGERLVIEAIERDVSKLGFDVGMRMMYLAFNENFNIINIPSMIGTMKQYNSLHLNGFKPIRATSVDYFFKKRREARLKRSMLSAYRQRSYFYLPYVRESFILNTEELATIFHFPGGVAETPTFTRIEAKKAGPPSNLPF
ncbi:MAG: hypothetical protein AB1643_00275 [Patescibacteria group bacterium]